MVFLACYNPKIKKKSHIIAVLKAPWPNVIPTYNIIFNIVFKNKECHPYLYD